MRRTALMSTLALTAAIALPASVLGGADVLVRKEVRTGAQAVFDTAVFDVGGNVVPGKYVLVLVDVDVSTLVEGHDRIDTRERSLSASVQRYEVPAEGRWIWETIADGSTLDATITLDPSFRSASASGVVPMQSCDYFAEPVTCIDRGTIQISVEFTGTTRMDPEPQHYTLPPPFGGLYVQHGAAILRSLSATGALNGEDLGLSVWGNFYRVHQGETYVWLPEHGSA